jgi:hypothetical protein
MALCGNYVEMVKFLSFPNITFEIGTIMAFCGNYVEMVKFLSFPNITFEIGTLSCLVILEPCNS